MNKEQTLRLLAAGIFLLAAPGADCRAGPEHRFVAEASSPRPATPPGKPTRARATFRFDRGFTALGYRLRVTQASALLGADLRCGAPANPGPVVAHLLGRIEGGLAGTVLIQAALTDANLAPGADCMAAAGMAITCLGDLAAAMERGAVYLEAVSANLPEGGIRGPVKPARMAARTQQSATDDPLELARTALSRADAALTLAQAAAGQAALAGNGAQAARQGVGDFGGSSRAAAQGAVQNAALAITEATAARNTAGVAARMAEDAAAQAEGRDPNRQREAEAVLRLAGRALVLATTALTEAQAALAAAQALPF